MNDLQMATLVERVGDALEPDVARLVAAGVARGRTRRRRRAVGGVLAGVAVVGAVVLTGVVLPRGSTDAGPRPADPARQLAVAPEDMDATLASLLPGATVAEDDEPYRFQFQRGVVTWRGSEVSVTIDSRNAGTSTSPRDRCESVWDDCTETPGGGWVAEHGTIEFDQLTGGVETYYDVVRVYEPGGYVIEAVGERGPSEAVDRGEGSDADRDLLRSLALDDVWLR